MALFAGGLRRAGHIFRGYDLNIDMYREMGPSGEHLWRDDHAPYWSDAGFIDKVIFKHHKFLESYIDDVLLAAPDVLCVSIQSASTCFGLAFARRIRERAPGLFMLFGGPDCFLSERGLSLLSEKGVDAICTGEGDEVLPVYLAALAQAGMRPVEMKGFCHRKPDGSIFNGGQPDAVANLDGLAFADFSGIHFDRYSINNRIAMMTSRGCILRCAYCSEGANFLKFRSRSPESLIAEVEQHVSMLRKVSEQRPHINFSDSLIDGRPELLQRFCELVLDRGIDFTWGGMALLRREISREMLSLMRRAGCVELMWGLESGSTATLRLMRKKLFDTTLAEQIFRDAFELGIDQYTNIIVGFPGETTEQFAETLEFARRIKPYFRSIGLPMMEIRRNSHVYDQPAKYGVLDPENGATWRTTDGGNTFEIRSQRRAALMEVVSDILFDQGRYEEPAR
jgi:radical SAM superfamily enzyme YgiQ (UPF0313 family)